MKGKTAFVKLSDVEQNWYEIDASGKILGRLASYISEILQGKNDVRFVRGVNFQNHVIVTNSDKIHLTGKKDKQKVYYRHTGYTGNLKRTPFLEQMQKDSTLVVKSAVKGMLPSNTLGRHLLKNLRVFSGATHSHEPQKPSILEWKDRREEVQS